MITTIQYPDGDVLDLEYKDDGHSYKVLTAGIHQGKVNGVTTALKVIAKDGLIPWAAKMVTTYIEENCKVDEGVYFVSPADLKKAKVAHSTHRDARADQGTQLHDLIEQHIRGAEPEVPEPLQGRYEAFLRWEAVNEPEYLLDLVEKPVFSRQHGYAGKPDIPLFLNNRYGILDLKSGKPDAEYNPRKHEYTGRYRAYAEHFYQCAAYDIALEEEHSRPAEFYAVVYLDHLESNDGAWFMTNNVQYFRESWLHTWKLYTARKVLNKENAYE